MYIISGCLLGIPCKYNGGSNDCQWVKDFAAAHDHVVVCPETAGGLPVPRHPAEQVWMPLDWKAMAASAKPSGIAGADADGPAPDRDSPEREEVLCIIDREGKDLTEAFLRGSMACLEQVLLEAEKRKFETMSLSPTNMADGIIEGAILKAHSPSCGNGKIYDGTFTHTLTAGDGVFAALLKAHGIPVYTEEDGNHFGYEEEK